MRILKFFSRYYLNIIVICLTLIMTGLLLMYFYPWKVATFNKIDVVGEVSAGGTITYQLDLCRYVAKGTKVEPRRFLVPQGKSLSQAIQLSSSASLETAGEPGCYKNAPVTIPVEVGTPPGKYQLMIQVQYCLFPGRCIPVEKRSDLFTIDEPNIPDRISVLTQSIEQFNTYFRQQQQAIGNTPPYRELPQVDRPSADGTTQSEQSTPAPVADNPTVTSPTTLEKLLAPIQNVFVPVVRDVRDLIGL